MPRTIHLTPGRRRLNAVLARAALAGALCGALAPAATAAQASGWIEPPPVVAFSALARAQSDLDILQAAIEAYRGQHFFRYPEASTLVELVRLLDARRLLPPGFSPTLELSEFRADRKGYRISARVDAEVLTIQTPERFDPFWSFLW
ncbi:MAG TPA: hypothetical protein V6D00_11275 [Pantanalinema sp.]